VNGNIKRLAKEANLLEKPAITWSCAPVEVNFFTNAMIEKFAELIVRECQDFVGDKGSMAVKEMLEHFGVET
jgi:hypothetical protein